jgi:transposase
VPIPQSHRDPLIPRLARTRPALEEDLLGRTVLTSLNSLERRFQHLGAEAAVLDAELEQLVTQANPSLRQVKGIGTVTAAQLMITDGENADRLKSEAFFAALCGTNMHADSVLHQIAVARITYDQRTRDYIARNDRKGRTRRRSSAVSSARSPEKPSI